MAITTVLESLSPIAFNSTPKVMRVCFSYAAYAKNLIDHLKSSNILVEKGLTEAEFSSIESVFHFSFPPDLRSILQEGLPVGHGFPNWRSSSKQQLEILVNLPVLELCKQVSIHSFWLDSWGGRPNDSDQAASLAKGLLKKAPLLVPIYRQFYIPTRPSVAGNPIFYVHGGEVKLWSFDIAGFFQQFDQFGRDDGVLRRPTLSKLLNAPPWAATEAKRVEFWTELAEKGDRESAADGTPEWWWWRNGDLRGCLEEVCSRLRNGGWEEEDVREMMMMDGRDELDHGNSNRHDGSNLVMIDKEGLLWHVKMLSKRLLRGGWSTEDVMDSLGVLDDSNGIGDEDSLFDFGTTQPAGGDQKKYCNNQLITTTSQKKSRIGFQIDRSLLSHNERVMTRRMPILN